MPKVIFFIQTNMVGSKCQTEVDVPDEQMNEDDLTEIGKDVIWNMAEWGWEEAKQD